MNRLLFLLIMLLNLPAIAQQGYFIDNLKNPDDSRYFDQTIKSFMRKYTIPGLSIAIARNGELIFAKGYGYADRASGRETGIIDQFRIASISKPITAVAILKLAETGKLTLDDKVFGKQGILKIASPDTNSYIEDITIRHLLEHTAAKEWTNSSNDPMFIYPHLSRIELVEKILLERTLTEPSGSRYTYSNFGYCILGLVIEEITSMRYSDYVKQNLFTPINAKSFDIADAMPGNSITEVHYYDDAADPYGFPIKRMDSHGGWKANAIDLVLFSLSVDGLSRPADILSPASIKYMTSPTKSNPQYALGWNINQYGNRWHNGLLPGTASILVTTAHGYSWAVLMNKRSNQQDFSGDLDRLPWDLVNHLSRN